MYNLLKQWTWSFYYLMYLDNADNDNADDVLDNRYHV